MGGRLISNTIILAAIEATQGVDAAPTPAANSILALNVKITPFDAKTVDNNVFRGFLGNAGVTVVTGSVGIEFEVYASGSGTAGTPPALAPLFKACGMAEAILATPARVEYTPLPIGGAMQSVTIYYYDSGMLHKVVGATGNVKLSCKVGEFSKLSFKFIGADGGKSTASVPVGTFTAWKPAVPISKATVTDLNIGCTYAAGAVTGGNVYPTFGPEFDLGNPVEFFFNCSSERAEVTDRSAKGAVTFELTAAQEVTLYGQFKNNVYSAVSFSVGTAVGNKLLIFCPSVQFFNYQLGEQSKIRVVPYDMNICPVNGGDEIRFVFL